MSKPVIEMKGICKAFSGNRVLSNIDLIVNPGEILCLVGENGSGKSTLIKIISGVYTYDAGHLRINGKSFQNITTTQSIDEGIQVIYQDFSLFPNLTVAENISMSYRIQKRKKFINWVFNKKLATEALEKIGVKVDLNLEVGQLPVAQKQIVAITRAIIQQAKLIIMDEPTTALTQKEIVRLFEIINGLKAQGISVIFVSHKLDEVTTISDRIVVIRSGEKVVDEVFENFQKEKLVYYMTGKEIEEEPFVCEKVSGEPLIEVQNISRQGEFENVSFAVHSGEILAITGQLGSGRTELAKSLFGITPITKGRILINGIEKKINSRKDALDNGVAYLPEDRLTEGLFLNRSLGDNFASTIIDKIKNKYGIVPEKRMEELSEHWMTELNMSKKPYTTPVRNYSGGNQQRIVIGKWLAAEPKIFILNCPTVGVDVKSKSEIHTIMKNLAKKGLAIIMISNDIGEIISTSNRVIVMNSGKVIFEGITKDISPKELDERIILTQ